MKIDISKLFRYIDTQNKLHIYLLTESNLHDYKTIYCRCFPKIKYDPEKEVWKIFHNSMRKEGLLLSERKIDDSQYLEDNKRQK